MVVAMISNDQVSQTTRFDHPPHGGMIEFRQIDSDRTQRFGPGVIFISERGS